MLKIFFNKESKILYFGEIIGLIATLLLTIRWWPGKYGIITKSAFFAYLILYLFIRICALSNFYDGNGLRTFKLRINSFFKKETYNGIELQFKKAMVPTSYILPIFGILMLIGGGRIFLYIALFFLIVIAHVNVILLYFHMRDNEQLPVNYFTSENYSTNELDK